MRSGAPAPWVTSVATMGTGGAPAPWVTRVAQLNGKGAGAAASNGAAPAGSPRRVVRHS